VKILLLSHRQHEGDYLASALAQFGHEVTAAGATWGKKHRIGYLAEAVKLIYREASKYQLIIFDGALYDTVVALMAHRLKGIPLVLYLKGYFPAEQEENANKNLQKFSGWLKSHLIKSSSHIVYVSQWLRDKYLNHPKLAMLKDKPSTIIHNRRENQRAKSWRQGCPYWRSWLE